MTKLGKVIDTAKAHTAGGRDGGSSRTDEGRLDITLSASGNGTNPGQPFAAGWSACFLSAIKVLARKKRVVLPACVAIEAEVELKVALKAELSCL